MPNGGIIPPPPPLPLTKLFATPVTHDKDIEATTETSDCMRLVELSLSPLRSSDSRSDTDNRSIILVVNSRLQPIIQEGPTCGIVALVMALRLLDFDVSVDTALKEAIEMNISKRGEMFSAESMKNLSDRLTGDAIESFIVRDLDRKDEIHNFLDHVMKGWPVMIPYDSDANHEPCLRRGKRAHWTVVFGFQVSWPEEDGNDPVMKIITDVSKLSTEDRQFIHNKTSLSLLSVLTKQGKSKYTRNWSFQKLIESNKNLVEVADKISRNIDSYVTPEGGSLVKSLANQVVFFRPKN